MYVDQQKILESLVQLAPVIRSHAIEARTIAETVAENPWFTEYYIRRRLDGIAIWLDVSVLTDFVSAYPQQKNPAKQIGVIAAGNIPLVGIHDVFVVLLSGNICLLKPSGQDRVLINWIRNKWIQIYPEIANLFQITSQLTQPDFLIATGSNNSARYFEANYGHIAHLIRKNRYSVAILEENLGEKEIEGLCEDILLFNGLGCRNVSNLIINPGFDWGMLEEKLAEYSTKHLNPLYLERVLYEKKRIELLEGKVKVYPHVLLHPSTSFMYSTMGILHGVTVQSDKEADQLIEKHANEIQCVVGRDTKFGETQFPGLKDFADNMDIMEVICSL